MNIAALFVRRPVMTLLVMIGILIFGLLTWVVGRRALGFTWSELGWAGMAIPEQYGGTGIAMTDVAVLFEELGTGPVPGPLFSSAVLCARIGMSPWDALGQAGITPVADYAMEPIESSIVDAALYAGITTENRGASCTNWPPVRHTTGECYSQSQSRSKYTCRPSRSCRHTSREAHASIIITSPTGTKGER